MLDVTESREMISYLGTAAGGERKLAKRADDSVGVLGCGDRANLVSVRGLCAVFKIQARNIGCRIHFHHGWHNLG